MYPKNKNCIILVQIQNIRIRAEMLPPLCRNISTGNYAFPDSCAGTFLGQIFAQIIGGWGRCMIVS